MVEDDPDRLERQACRYERMMRYVTDEQALHALQEMALASRIRAKEIRKEELCLEPCGQASIET